MTASDVPFVTRKKDANYKTLNQEDLEDSTGLALSKMSKSRFSWKFPALLSLAIVLLSWPVTLPGATWSPLDIAARTALADPPRQSNNLTDVVQWDNYTLFVNDQRIFL